MAKKQTVKARVLVDCVINGQDCKSGAVIEGAEKALKDYLGDSLDKSAAAVKYALSEGVEVQVIADAVEPQGEQAEPESDDSSEPAAES